MPLETIAILSPGDMGHAVGRALHEHGFDVITCLAGRSEHTRALAERGRLRDVPDLETLVGEADLVFSILPPHAAEATAQEVAAAMSSADAAPAYADMNAISPALTKALGATITAAGAPFIDGGIVGPPPGRGQPPRFYVSGEATPVVHELDGKGIQVKGMGAEIGRASAIKMCFAALTKGTNTLRVALLMAAERLGVFDELAAELDYSQAGAIDGMRRVIPGLARNSGRWIREMEEIAATFEQAGVTPRFHEGAAWVHRVLATTPYADETRDSFDPDRTLEDAIKTFVAHLPKNREAAD